MTYAKMVVGVVVANDADYTSQVRRYSFQEYEFQPSQVTELRVTADSSLATALDISNHGTIKAVIIKNLDATNFVAVTTTALSDLSAVTQEVPAGGLIVLTDVDPTDSLDLLADTADCLCDVIIFSAT